MRYSTRAAHITVAVVALCLSACDGSKPETTQGPPSVSALSTALSQSGEFTEKQAPCVSKVLIASGMSDQWLRAVESGTAQNMELSAKESSIVEDLGSEVASCL